MTRQVVPITNIGSPAEHGRIRLGVKTSTKERFKAIDTFRFTSPDINAIEQLAELYGGTARPWHDDRASPPDQFEVITEAHEIEVLLPTSGALSLWYEVWGGGGIVRRCDGVVMSVPASDEGWIEGPCQCDTQGFLECQTKTRLNCFLPGVNFAGTWRLESGSEIVFHTFTGMVGALAQIQAMAPDGAGGSFIKCFIRLDHQVRRRKGQTRKFIIPVMRLDHSITQITEGVTGPALSAVAEPLVLAAPESAQEPDAVDDVVDAEIVEGGLSQPRTWDSPGDIPKGVKVKKRNDRYEEDLA